MKIIVGNWQVLTNFKIELYFKKAPSGAFLIDKKILILYNKFNY